MQFAKLQTSPTNKIDGRIYLSPYSISHALGKLLILININLHELKGEAKLNALIDYILNSYYQTEDSKLDPETSLEELILKINKDIPAYLPLDMQTKKNLAMFIGVLSNQQLYFAKTGNIKLLLYHGLNLINIRDEAETENEEAIFSFITSGQISEDDILLITSESLLDYFSQGKLKQILETNSAEKASSEFSKLIQEFSKHTFFQSLIINNQKSPEATKADQLPVSELAHTSITDLNALESKTSELLTSSFWISFKKSFLILLYQIKGIFGSRVFQAQTSTEMAIKRRLRQKSIFSRMLGWMLNIFKTIFLIAAWIFKQLIYIFIQIFKHRKDFIYRIKDKSKSLPSRFSAAINKKVDQYKKLDKRRQTLLLVSIGLIIILLMSIILGISRKLTGISKEEAISILDEIEVKQASAQAALIYSNEKQAVSLISEGRRLLEALDVKNSDLKKRKSEIAQQLFDLYMKTQKLERIDSPRLIADLSQNLDAAMKQSQIKMVKLAGFGDKFYGYSNNKIYQFSTANKLVEGIANLSKEINGLKVLGDNELLVYTQDPEAQMSILNLDNNTLSPLQFNFNNPITYKIDFDVYFSRLYVLDPRERQIFKHQKVGETYTRGQPWLVDNTVDLSESTSMAIDGNIWITTASGNLYKLSAGEKTDFSLDMLDPKPNNPNFIWTSIDSAKIYILDPATRRLIILNKDNTIFKQFVSETFSDLKSAVIDEINNKVYVLNGNKIFEVSLE